MKNRKVWAVDAECYPNFFLLCFINVDTLERRKFWSFENISSLPACVNFITHEVRGIVTVNGIHYDNALIKHVIDTQGQCTVSSLYDLSEDAIHSEFPILKDNEFPIPHIDIMKVLHLDRFGIGLKAAAIWLRHETVQDLPISPGCIIIVSQLEDLIKYCFNDTEITVKLFHKFKKSVDMRKGINKSFGIDVLNKADAQIGSEIMLSLLSKDTGEHPSKIKTGRTYRNKIKLSDCIPHYIKFQTKEFKGLLKEIKETVIEKGEDNFKKSVWYSDMNWDYGVGGLHSCSTPGEYSGNIIASDFSSFYPNLAINLDIRPEHLGESFSNIYRSIYVERKKHPKGSTENSAYKLALNGLFGKFKSEYSYLYDPLALYRITLAGQLTITMHCEKLILAGIRVFICNTDGYSVILKEGQEELYYRLCKDTEELTGITLDHTPVKKMLLSDVNNYIEIPTQGEVKLKGRYNYERLITQNPSQLIVPKAVELYFTEGIAVEKTIRECRDIYDFCMRSKTTKGWKHVYNEEQQQKNIRYYVSNKGSPLVKKHEDGRVLSVCANRRTTLFNNYKKGPYDIDYAFYIAECYKLIESITPKQLTLL